MINRFLHKIFDPEGVDTIEYMMVYIAIWCVLFLALMYLEDHMYFFKGRIYDFPIPPAREPLPKQEVVNE